MTYMDYAEIVSREFVLELQSQNRKILADAVAEGSKDDFFYCVRCLDLAFPGEVEQRIADTFGADLWPYVRFYYRETVIALLPLELSAYVFLWILEWLPEFRVAREQKRKVYMIAGLIASRRQVLQSRDALANRTRAQPK